MNERLFYEFFAGGGMARAGLGKDWRCVFANDFDATKASAYRDNWGDEHLLVGDINAIDVNSLPGQADLAWASFPCQDLSLAGNSAGLGTEGAQTRSGAFWAFWRLMQGLIDARRPPRMIVLENVYGSLTANQGRDFAVIARSLALGGYRFGAILLDAVHFVPQSRPRVFIVAMQRDMAMVDGLLSDCASAPWHPSAMGRAIDRLAELDRDSWLWLDPPTPKQRNVLLDSLILDQPTDVDWHSAVETQRLIDMMTPVHRAKLAAMNSKRSRQVGTIYKRTRADASGVRHQRAELRDDGIAGCLRTPGGGSSRQIVLVTEQSAVRTRLLSAREAARLMGLPDSYRLPARYNDAYHLAGDGLVVPAVRWLAQTVIEPILDANPRRDARQAA